MAFWAQASAGQGSRPNNSARPLTYILSAGANSLTDFTTLVRLRVDVAPAAASLAAAAQGAEDEETAAQQGEDAACAVGQLHQVVVGIEQASDEARSSSLLELMGDKTLQLLCSKTVVAKVYKSLLPHQAAVGYSMAPAEACLSQKPVAAGDLAESLQTAVIKTLTGCSSGTPPNSSTATTPATTATAAVSTEAAAADAPPVWMCLSRHKVVGSNLLAAAPGVLSTAPFAEMEVKFDAAGKGLLLIIHAAGSYKFRLLSPMQALQQEPKALRAPLSLSDTDADLLADSAKLSAAARQLDGRAVKLLPDERLAFIKGVAAAPTDTSQRQRIAQYWLGSYGLQLPPSYPFMVGVAAHPAAEAAQLQVPSCCVLTNLGLSVLPGSSAGAGHQAAVSKLVSDLQAGAAQYAFWGQSLTVQLKDSRQPGAVLSQAHVQVTQGSQPADHTAEAAPAAQLKAYTLSTEWTSAAQLSKMQRSTQSELAAAGGGANAGVAAAAAAAQLMGLVEAEGTWGSAGVTGQPGECRTQQPGRGGGSSIDKERWQGLRVYLTEREREQQQQQKQQQPPAGRVLQAGLGRAAGGVTAAAVGGLSTAAAGAGAAAAPAVRPAAAAAGNGPPAAPMFGSRKPAASKPPAAAAKATGASRKPAGAGVKVGGATARLLAAVQAGQADTPAAGSTDGAAAAAPSAGGVAAAGGVKAPTLGKRPGAGAEAAAKPPAAKKAKGAAAAGGAAGGAKPKATKPKAPKAAAAGASAAGEAAAGSGAPGVPAAAAAPPAADAVGSQPAAAELQQQQRKRTKASDLDVSAVSSKIQAAFAASAGAALKGVSVPEMQCYLRSQGVKGGSAKRADVEACLLALLAGNQPNAGSS